MATSPRDDRPASLLVVDDNEMNRDMLSRRLSRRGHRVLVAADGQQALAMLDEHTVDLMLLDVTMPNMDGLEVLARVRAVHSMGDLPVIMATARDRSEDVVAALELGANDYVIKPLDFRVVFARVQTQLALKRATRALETANARMKKDLDAAASLQRALMPRILPDVNGAEFGWRFLPCTELAGDIFDIVQLNDDSVGIYMLDVCGHGVPAALLSVTLSRVLSHMGEEAVLKRRGLTGDYHVAAPPEVADTLNRRFPMDPETNQYFTFAYGVLDVTAREFKYVTAGHPGPIHVPRGKEPVFHDGAGFAIGWFPNPHYEERTIQLQPGDRLYFYSDGVTDAKGTGLDMFERERLADVLVESRGCLLEESLQAIVDRVTAWCGDGGPDDDISLVAFEFSP